MAHIDSVLITTSAAEFCKSKWSFRISNTKLLHIDSNKDGFKQVYGDAFTEHPVLKRGQQSTNFKPTVSPMVNCVKPITKDNVLKLIDKIGVSDQVRRLYLEAFIDVGRQHVGRQDFEECSDKTYSLTFLCYKKIYKLGCLFLR